MTETVLIATPSGFYIWIDAVDLDRVQKHYWSIRRQMSDHHRAPRCHYAQARVGDRTIGLHRFILDLGPGDPPVDHINGDGLDNRRGNLRRSSRLENGRNQHRGAAPLSEGKLPPGVPVVPLVRAARARGV